MPIVRMDMATWWLRITRAGKCELRRRSTYARRRRGVLPGAAASCLTRPGDSDAVTGLQARWAAPPGRQTAAVRMLAALVPVRSRTPSPGTRSAAAARSFFSVTSTIEQPFSPPNWQDCQAIFRDFHINARLTSGPPVGVDLGIAADIQRAHQRGITPETFYAIWRSALSGSAESPAGR